MFVHTHRLPHVLSPRCYHAADAYEHERERVLHRAWYMVGTTSELAKPGDFLTCELLGVPVQVRNFEGELKALSNVCAHRHCLISSRAGGNSPRMNCQYHGWEYDARGRTGKIPQPKNFSPFEETSRQIPTYRLDTCGQLVFVSISSDGPSLSEFLGDMYDRLAERFGVDWQPFLKWNPEYSVNWKVPIENSLEAYHVPYVHPNTFRHDPGSERSTHVLNGKHTWFGTDLPFSPHSKLDATFQRCEGWITRRLGAEPRGRYEQHHIFPNLLCSFTDVISLCHCVVPTGPTTCRAVVRQFGRVGPRAPLPWNWLARGWGYLEGLITRHILHEDLALFPAMQRGLETSSQAGLLGACEERLWAFQSWLARECPELPTQPHETSENNNQPLDDERRRQIATS